MIKTFTQNDLIRFIYHETSEQEEKEINHALLCDGELKAQYNELQSLKNELDTARLEPSASAIQNIINYSRGVQRK